MRTQCRRSGRVRLLAITPACLHVADRGEQWPPLPSKKGWPACDECGRRWSPWCFTDRLPCYGGMPTTTRAPSSKPTKEPFVFLPGYGATRARKTPPPMGLHDARNGTLPVPSSSVSYITRCRCFEQQLCYRTYSLSELYFGCVGCDGDGSAKPREKERERKREREG